MGNISDFLRTAARQKKELDSAINRMNGCADEVSALRVVMERSETELIKLDGSIQDVQNTILPIGETGNHTIEIAESIDKKLSGFKCNRPGASTNELLELNRKVGMTHESVLAITNMSLPESVEKIHKTLTNIYKKQQYRRLLFGLLLFSMLLLPTLYQVIVSRSLFAEITEELHDGINKKSTVENRLPVVNGKYTEPSVVQDEYVIALQEMVKNKAPFSRLIGLEAQWFALQELRNHERFVEMQSWHPPQIPLPGEKSQPFEIHEIYYEQCTWNNSLPGKSDITRNIEKVKSLVESKRKTGDVVVVEFRGSADLRSVENCSQIDDQISNNTLLAIHRAEFLRQKIESLDVYKRLFDDYENIAVVLSTEKELRKCWLWGKTRDCNGRNRSARMLIY